MYFDILESGSKGNCSIISSENTRIVIDCGGTGKYLKDAFDKVNVDYQSVDALLLTHEHSDHISQLKLFSNTRVFAPIAYTGVKYMNVIKPYQTFKIGDFTILPLPLSHDASKTVGYIITDGKETLVQVTDTGYISNSNLQLMMYADYYIIESNHDPDMLMATKRPAMTKHRILSDNGHMSNEYCSDIVYKCLADNTKEIVLAHISEEANTYQLACDTLTDLLVSKNIDPKKYKIAAAKQYEIYQGGQR